MVSALPPSPLAARPLVVDVSIDSSTWLVIASVLTVVGLAIAVLAWSRRGPAAGLRALAWTLVPVAAWLTGTLRMITRILSAILTWATGLVFSPRVWAGVAVAAVAALLFLVSAVMRSRGVGVRRRGLPVRQQTLERGDAPYRVSGRTERPSRAERKAEKKATRGGQQDQQDDEGMDEIAAILKKHGI